MKLLTPMGRIIAIVFTLSLALCMAFGFLPMVSRFWDLHWGFPFMALLFLISLPGRHPRWGVRNPRALLLTFIGPILIASLYGLLRRSLGPNPSPTSAELFWLVVSIPLGEELLFRGWFYEVVDRLYPETDFTLIAPLTAAIWMSSLAFSVWHLQNLWTQPWYWGALQIFYTFWLGIWFGWLREQSKGLIVPILAHSAVNAASLML